MSSARRLHWRYLNGFGRPFINGSFCEKSRKKTQLSRERKQRCRKRQFTSLCGGRLNLTSRTEPGRQRAPNIQTNWTPPSFAQPGRGGGTIGTVPRKCFNSSTLRLPAPGSGLRKLPVIPAGRHEGLLSVRFRLPYAGIGVPRRRLTGG